MRETIGKSLNELKELRNKTINQNLNSILGIKPSEFKQRLTSETDARKRTQCILEISNIAEDKIFGKEKQKS